MLAELEHGSPADTIVRKYTWGLDLSQTLAGAGGIGGLLALEEPQTVGDPLKYVYVYDANGNVGQVVDLTAADAASAIVAKYEYDAYGQQIGLSMLAYRQPFRFSTKYHDSETGLAYFGHRYYRPWLGRWISRDPLGELGGLNLYSYIGNRPTFVVELPEKTCWAS